MCNRNHSRLRHTLSKISFSSKTGALSRVSFPTYLSLHETVVHLLTVCDNTVFLGMVLYPDYMYGSLKHDWTQQTQEWVHIRVCVYVYNGAIHHGFHISYLQKSAPSSSLTLAHLSITGLHQGSPKILLPTTSLKMAWHPQGQPYLKERKGSAQRSQWGAENTRDWTFGSLSLSLPAE